MTDTLLAAVLIAGTVALAIGPLLLPWPWKLRWIVTAEAVNPLIAVSNAHHHVQLEEVVLVKFADDHATLVVVVEPDRGEPRARTELVGPPCSIGELAALEGWYTGRTPLLLVEEEGGVATLQGPHRAITGLHQPHHDNSPILA